MSTRAEVRPPLDNATAVTLIAVPDLITEKPETTVDKERIEARIRELEENYKAGEAQLRKLETQRQELQQAQLRIGGAIQVLREMLGEMPRTPQPGSR
jgi:hypothetical protein